MNERQQLDPALAPPAAHLAGYGSLDGHLDPDTPRRWWDAAARQYLSEHGQALGGADFVWGPEGLREADARLLGEEITNARVLEVGAGAKQCSRWLAGQGAQVVASDISGAMLAAGARLDRETGQHVPAVQADARALPFASGVFDVVFTSYGVLPFVPDAVQVHREAARVLRDGGRWVFSTTHPVRWSFPDDPGENGLTARRGYFDTAPYLERDESGQVVYAEFHRPLGQLVAEVVEAGFLVEGLVEPTWQPGRSTWGGWSQLRAHHLPGTVILQCRREQRDPSAR